MFNRDFCLCYMHAQTSYSLQQERAAITRLQREREITLSDAECIQVANKLATYKGGLELGELPWGPVYIPLTVKPHCNGRGFAYAS